MDTIKYIKIIFENNDLLVINKPAGMRVHTDAYGTGRTVVDWIMVNYPALDQVGEPMTLTNGKLAPRPGIVHRLDRDTSGVLIIAKTKEAFDQLKQQFQSRQIKKTYLALLTGRMTKADKQTITLPIGRSRNDPRIRVASHKARGRLRKAETVYQVIKTYAHFTLVEAYPVTGRTHQLRAHFKAIQYPIACDHLYSQTGHCPAGLDRQALHAYKLELMVPGTGEKRVFEAPIPPDLKAALDNLAVA